MAEPMGGGAEERSAVDWADLRRRIVAAGAPLAGAADSPEQMRSVLDARARELAAEQPTPSSPPLEVLVFDLAGEAYAIGTEHVIAVFPLETLTPVPGANPLALGITEWRGDLLTIVDLRRLLDLPGRKLDDLSMAVVLGSGRPRFAVLADVVRGLSSVSTADVHPPDDARTPHEHIRGLTPEAVMLLDAESLLSDATTRST